MSEHWDEVLMGEHRLLEKVAGVLVSEVGKSTTVGEMAKESRARVTRSLDFFETFMDKCHNQKEEKVLFPLLEQRGIPKEGGPIGVMLLEHEKEREFIRKIKGSLAEENIKQMLVDSKNFSELLKDHVWKEDETLYPMGKRVLSEADGKKLLSGFDGIEKGLGKGVHEKYLKSAEELEKEAGPQPLIKNLSTEALDVILDTLPFEITFIDSDETLRYFNKEKEKKYFARPRAAIGRKVQKCHPEKSIRSVNQLLADLRSGKKNVAESWIDVKGRKIYIRYFAVRDQNNRYLGTMEVVQDITDIKKIEGENRIVK
jgi:PAS domain S-box-containing protein